MILPTLQPKNCLADCLTKASAKADNLITVVKTWRLSEEDVHPNFRTFMEQKTFCLHGVEDSCTQGERCFLPECLEDFSRTNSMRRTIPCDVSGNSHEFRESRCYENNVCTRRLTHLFLLDDFFLGETKVLVLGSLDQFLSVPTSFSQLGEHVIIKTDWCDCKEEEKCDSEVESEDDGWLDTEKHWSPLLDLSYHYFVGPLLLGFIEEMD